MIYHKSNAGYKSHSFYKSGCQAAAVDCELKYLQRRKENALKYKELGKKMKEERGNGSDK